MEKADSMNRNLKRILIFILPLVVLAYPVDYLISVNLKKSNWFACGEYPVWNDIYSGQVNSKIVIYGSSKAWTGINPQVIEDSLGLSCYNLGIDGHNFRMEYLRHLEYLENNPQPEIILMSVDVLSLYTRVDLYNYEQFLPYIYRKNVREYTSGYQGFTRFDYLLPLARYIGESEAVTVAFENLLSLGNTSTERVKGFKANDYQWTDEFAKAKAMMDTYHVNLDPESIRLFDVFLADCQERGIDVVLVLTPDYIEGQEFIDNRAEVVQYYRDFSARYDIPFLDYSSDPICLEKGYFYNSSHMNKKGTEVFEKMFIADLKKLNTVIKHTGINKVPVNGD